MKIIITLKDTTYKAITTLNTISEHLQAEVVRAIKNGSVLPKGHGDLIDADKLWDAYQDMGQDFYQALDCVSAVIEADKE